MANKGIIFSAPMVRALLDGRKTQTRRLIKPQPTRAACGRWWDWEKNGGGGAHADDVGNFARMLPVFMPYAPGDRLYVREGWGTWGIFDDLAPSKLTGKEGIAYAADYSEPRGEICGRLRPSIHMPRWASRLWLAVTDVRVQRVQDISDGDAIAEGIRRIGEEFGAGERPTGFDRGPNFWTVGIEGWSLNAPTPGETFKLLWNSLHDKPGERWDDNPWIVAITFEVNHGNIDQTAAPLEGARSSKGGR